jgi:hypothetical protein
MISPMSFRILLFLGLLSSLSILSAAEPFFPMQQGNFWEYRTPDGKHSFRVGGFTPLSTGSHVYFFVNGFGPQQLVIREELGVGLKLYDQETGADTLFTSLDPDRDPNFLAPDRGCGFVTGRVHADRVAEATPTGYYASMLMVTYDTPACGEPVVASELYVANIGMVRRVVKIGEETRQYDLVAARVGGQVILSNTQTNLTALTWQEPRQGDAVLRFRLETLPGLAARTAMHFATSQRYDLIIRDQSGRKLWQYSDGMAFLQAIGQSDSANFEILVPLEDLPGGTIAQGVYQVDAWITTIEANPRFAASMDINVHDFGQPAPIAQASIHRSIARAKGSPRPRWH